MTYEESWVEIQDYPRYLVSDHGRVMNRETERILKPGNNGTGYLYVCLYNLEGSHNCYVHRLVAFHFLTCDDPSFEVNHIDGNKSNNFASNLEWVSRHQNIQHAFLNGFNHATRRANVRPVMIIETGEVFESIKSCAQAIGGSEARIQLLVKGIGKHHRGLSFRYADE